MLLAGCMGGNSLQTSGPSLDPLGDPLVLIGLREDPDREVIEYGPRAPLVIPNSAELPPPEQQVVEARADWPDDPDVRARRFNEEQRRAAARQGVRDFEEASRPMTRGELDEWGRRFGRVSGNEATASRRQDSEQMHPDELAARTADPDDVSYMEPPRRRLTDPPSGYRRRADTGEPEVEEEGGLLSGLFGRGGRAPENRSPDHRADPTRDF